MNDGYYGGDYWISLVDMDTGATKAANTRLTIDKRADGWKMDWGQLVVIYPDFSWKIGIQN